jgi:hypothetical protein
LNLNAKDPDTAMHSFCAMSGLIKPCREAILLNHLQQLMPLLTSQLKAQAHKYQLDINEASTKPYALSTLGTLQSIFAANPPSMKDTFEAILDSVLVFTTYKHSPRVRLIAVQIVHSFASIPFQHTRTHKDKITKALRAVLDDNKRGIRKWATDTQHKWYSMSDPEAQA